MVEKIVENPEIYKIEVPLPENPLRYLNSYVVMNSQRPLIIDTGFNRPECEEAFMAGIEELGIDLANADIFITHVHGDHSGLAYKMHQKGAAIYMNPIDHNYFKDTLEGRVWGYLEALFQKEGFPEDIIKQQKNINQARIYAPEALYPIQPVNDGDIVHLAGLSFKAIWTPGHTKGHTCLYLAEKKLMFLGDHVLFDITPNITCWQNMKDALGDYLDSLEKIKIYPVEIPLPAHRKNEMPLDVRIEQIEDHHKERLANVENILRQNPGLTAYEIAMRLPWSMRGKTWDEFPAGQKWFATGETLSHLDYLLFRNRIKKNPDQQYFIC